VIIFKVIDFSPKPSGKLKNSRMSYAEIFTGVEKASVDLFAGRDCLFRIKSGCRDFYFSRFLIAKKPATIKFSLSETALSLVKQSAVF